MNIQQIRSATIIINFAGKRFLVDPMFTPKDGGEGLAPTYRTLGRWKYVGYVTSLVLCHQAAMLLFELFSFFNPIDMLIAYVGSSALTLMLVLVLGRLQGKKNRDTVHGG